MRLLIHGGRLASAGGDLVTADIAVVGNRIAAIGERPPLEASLGPPDGILDAGGRLVIPGLVNAHTHLFQTGMRGLGEGLPLETWHRTVMQPAYATITAEDAYWFTLLGLVENVRSGVTTVVNVQAWPNDLEACSLTTRAVDEAGVRAVLCRSFYGTAVDPRLRSERSSVLRDVAAVFERLDGSADGRVRFAVGPPRATRAPGDWIREVAAIAREHGAGVHTHVGETPDEAAEARDELGTTEVRFLDDLGVVDERFLAAHAVAISGDDARILGERGASVAYCPVSNMYLGSGIADVPALVAAGVNVALGTDGPASNDNQDMFAVMKTGSLLQKVARLDAAVLPANETFGMATSRGARAAAIEAGAIEVGRLADLAIVDLGGAHHAPFHRPLASLIYAGHADDVESVVVDGRVVMDHRRIIGVDEAEVIREASTRARRMAAAMGTR